MEGHDYIKEKYLNRLIREYTELQTFRPIISKESISLALDRCDPEAFIRVKAIAAMAIMCWSEKHDIRDNSSVLSLLRHLLNSKNPDELRIAIEHFLDYTDS